MKRLRVPDKDKSCAGPQGAFIEMVAECANVEPIIITRVCPWLRQANCIVVVEILEGGQKVDLVLVHQYRTGAVN